MVMPVTPTLVRASRTFSSVYGLMMASTLVIRGSPKCRDVASELHRGDVACILTGHPLAAVATPHGGRKAAADRSAAPVRQRRAASREHGVLRAPEPRGDCRALGCQPPRPLRGSMADGDCAA